jgi:hypothetical protein
MESKMFIGFEESEDYYNAASQWIHEIFKRATSELNVYERFDNAVGIRYIEQYSSTYSKIKDYAELTFEVINHKKFMLAAIKYNIKFKTLNHE